MTRMSLGALLAFAVMAGSASAQTLQGAATGTIQTQPAATAPAAASENDPMICKSMSADTGTRIGGRRVCQLSSVWKTQEADARRELQNSQQRGGMFSKPGN